MNERVGEKGLLYPDGRGELASGVVVDAYDEPFAGGCCSCCCFLLAKLRGIDLAAVPGPQKGNGFI